MQTPFPTHQQHRFPLSLSLSFTHTHTRQTDTTSRVHKGPCTELLLAFHPAAPLPPPVLSSVLKCRTVSFDSQNIVKGPTLVLFCVFILFVCARACVLLAFVTLCSATNSLVFLGLGTGFWVPRRSGTLNLNPKTLNPQKKNDLGDLAGISGHRGTSELTLFLPNPRKTWRPQLQTLACWSS
jgi:hypothetical protein